jgi:hypothetical protein
MTACPLHIIAGPPCPHCAAVARFEAQRREALMARVKRRGRPPSSDAVRPRYRCETCDLRKQPKAGRTPVGWTHVSWGWRCAGCAEARVA